MSYLNNSKAMNIALLPLNQALSLLMLVLPLGAYGH